MRIMGIDPGTVRMGVGILDESGDKLTFVHAGVLKASNSLEMHYRLSELFDQLCEISSKFKPDQIAIESVFSKVNFKSAIAIGQAQALGLIVAGKMELPVHFYTPTQVKKSITNYGLGTKQQVQDTLKVIFRIEHDLGLYDASDALAVGVCHANSIRFNEIIEKEVF